MSVRLVGHVSHMWELKRSLNVGIKCITAKRSVIQKWNMLPDSFSTFRSLDACRENESMKYDTLLLTLILMKCLEGIFMYITCAGCLHGRQLWISTVEAMYVSTLRWNSDRISVRPCDVDFLWTCNVRFLSRPKREWQEEVGYNSWNFIRFTIVAGSKQAEVDCSSFTFGVLDLDVYLWPWNFKCTA